MALQELVDFLSGRSLLFSGTQRLADIKVSSDKVFYRPEIFSLHVHVHCALLIGWAKTNLRDRFKSCPGD